jgi:hypothetical protein
MVAVHRRQPSAATGRRASRSCGSPSPRGRPGHAEAAREAIAIWETKGNVRMATGVRERLAELESPPPA